MKYFVIYLFCFVCFSLQAQEVKYDVLTKVSGEVIKIKVTEIKPDQISFHYPNENLIYTLLQSEVSQIEFASGRKQVFTNIDDLQNDTSNNSDLRGLEINREMMAVLPVTFLGTDNQDNSVVANRAQLHLFQQLSSHKDHKLQNIGTTNGLLRKNGINESNIANYSFDEIASILGVGYIVSSNVSLQITGTSTIHSSSRDNDIELKKNKVETRESTFGQSSTSNSKKTIVDMTVYDLEGNLIWTKTKTSIFGHSEAYQNSLKFLAKKMPDKL